MKITPKPADEKERIEKLRHYQLLDTIPENEFDHLTYLASQICQAPVALISLIDENRQRFQSQLGTDVSEAPREFALCAHAILEDELFLILDARMDERFADSPSLPLGPRQGSSITRTPSGRSTRA